MSDAAGQRALRKQLLLMRSATERAEMAQAVLATRQSVTAFKSGVPGLAMGKGLPLALGLIQRAPLISSLLPLLLAGARRPLLRYALLGAGAALLVWKGSQWLAAQRGPDEAPAEDGHAPPAD
jgi:hypothetical protein